MDPNHHRSFSPRASPASKYSDRDNPRRFPSSRAASRCGHAGAGTRLCFCSGPGENRLRRTPADWADWGCGKGIPLNMAESAPAPPWTVPPETSRHDLRREGLAHTRAMAVSRRVKSFNGDTPQNRRNIDLESVGNKCRQHCPGRLRSGRVVALGNENRYLATGIRSNVHASDPESAWDALQAFDQSTGRQGGGASCHPPYSAASIFSACLSWHSGNCAARDDLIS